MNKRQQDTSEKRVIIRVCVEKKTREREHR